jgi:phosphoglycolate phosphatase
MIKGIIFDLDGTTIYTIEDITDSINMALKEFGFPSKSISKVMAVIGRGSKKLIEEVTPKNTPEDIREKVLKRYLEIYRDNLDVKSEAYEGMVELLKTLEERGIRLAVNSNKPDDMTKKLIRKCYPDSSFVAVYGSRAGIPNKPDPYTANEIANLMGLKNNEIMYVGDSDVDMKTAENAGMSSCGCLWGYRDLENLRQAKAGYIASRPEDILRHIDEQ